MLKKLLSQVLIVAVICLSGLSLAESATIPKPTGFVNDFARVMDRRSQAEIQLIAEKLQKEQGIEIAVVTVQSTSPLTPKEYATELFNQWGIGGPQDSGLLLLLAMEERRVEVETGYGLEGSLPDGKVGAILDQVVMVHLSKQEYGQGLAAGAEAFRRELAGESFSQAASSDKDDWLKTFMIFLAIAIFISIQARRRPPGGPNGGGARYPGRFGGYHTTPRFPRSGGGGGFGGFGGGRSGGGGAGRKF